MQPSSIENLLIKNQLIESRLIENDLIESLLGHSRHHCAQALSNQGINSIEFGHWLAIPSQQLLLVFRHQRCVAVDAYQIAA
ncbi:MAG: hypothetical protein ACTH7W_02895 [Psychrobacter sp.]|uniref:hypothetical protein n=1 Tax=unclassified Psychrobacter TaxID=196806 RepID=UPI0017881669|nr:MULTISPECIES: hypothetical protein [unclassified Psychrobacter]MBE0442049.1 hypothetical protein [Psychrobacter sp. FME13]